MKRTLLLIALITAQGTAAQDEGKGIGNDLAGQRQSRAEVHTTSTHHCQWSNVCVNRTTMTLILDSDKPSFLVKPLFKTPNEMHYYSCQPLTSPECMCLPTAHNSYVVEQPTTAASSPAVFSAVILNLWPGNGQFGHTFSKIVQAIVLYLNVLKARGDVSTLAITSIPQDKRSFSLHLEYMIKVMRSLFTNTLRSDDDYNHTSLCPSQSFLVAHSERYFSTRDDVHAFRQLMTARLKIDSQLSLNLTRRCPPATAVVLQREDGGGTRDILNYDVIDRVFASFGIEYKNVSFGSKSSSRKQIEAFSTFGLMIAPHSSQLKNLVFAVDNAVVIEVKAQLYSVAFSESTEFLNIVYVHSVGHDADDDMVKRNQYYSTNLRKAVVQSAFRLNETIFRRDVAMALEKQRQHCGDLWTGPHS